MEAEPIIKKKSQSLNTDDSKKNEAPTKKKPKLAANQSTLSNFFKKA
jgi:hypothetical protein